MRMPYACAMPLPTRAKSRGVKHRVRPPCRGCHGAALAQARRASCLLSTKARLKNRRWPRPFNKGVKGGGALPIRSTSGLLVQRGLKSCCKALRPALSCHCLALPCSVLPRLALLRLALSSLSPSVVSLLTLSLPCLVLPCLALFCFAFALLVFCCLALPCFAVFVLRAPCLTLQCLAPCVASPCLALLPLPAASKLQSAPKPPWGLARRRSQVPRLQEVHVMPRRGYKTAQAFASASAPEGPCCAQNERNPAQVRLGSRRPMLCPKPSHGQTLPLRYTAHIVAGPVFDDILAAPVGGF